MKPVNLTDQVCIQIKTNITRNSGENVDFIYEIESIGTILKVGDNSIIGIQAQHFKQNLRII